MEKENPCANVKLRAGVPFKEIRDKYFEDEEFVKEYNKLRRREMSLTIKNAEEKAKFLFITNNQYAFLDGFIRVMDFEDGTSINVVGSEDSIYIKTCGMDITIISPEVDIKLINRKFNYVFVDVSLGFDRSDFDRFQPILMDTNEDFVYPTGVFAVNAYEADTVCEDLMNHYDGEEQFDDDEFDYEVSFNKEYRDYDESYSYDYASDDEY